MKCWYSESNGSDRCPAFVIAPTLHPFYTKINSKREVGMKKMVRELAEVRGTC